jgi:hypothetical protein
MGTFRVGEGNPAKAMFSADCGERQVAGGKTLKPKLALYFGTLPIYRGRVFEEMAGRLAGFLRDVATREMNEYLRLRAGAIRWENRSILFPSVPQRHLPALVGLLLRTGVEFLGDEMTYFDPVLLRAHSAGFPLFVDSEDLPLFPDLEREPARGRPARPVGEGFREATPRRLVLPEELGSRFAPPTSLGWMVFPEFREGARTAIEPVTTADAIFRFSAAVLNLHAWEDRALFLARDLVDSLPVSRLVIGSLPRAADEVLATAPDMIERG